jgi:membrane-bound serine protease (ClpP class)
MRISRALIISTVAVTSCFFLFVIGMGIKAQRRKPVTGIKALVGEPALTLDELNPSGRVSIHGEIWNAVSISGMISTAEQVRVTEVKNLILYVEHMRVL